MNKIITGTLILGGVFLLMGLWVLIDAYNSTRWNQVQGKIKELPIQGRIINTASATQRKIEYIVGIEYDYEINGQKYSGNRYSIGTGDTLAGAFNTKAEAREWKKNSNYKIGDFITVFVKPSDFESTVLSAGINLTTLIPTIMGVILIAVAFAMRFLLKRRKTPSSD